MWPYIRLGLASNCHTSVFFNLTSLSFSSSPLCHIKLGLKSVDLNGVISPACSGVWIGPKGRVSGIEWVPGGQAGSDFLPFLAMNKAQPPHLLVFALVLPQFNSHCRASGTRALPPALQMGRGLGVFAGQQLSRWTFT